VLHDAGDEKIDPTRHHILKAGHTLFKTTGIQNKLATLSEMARTGRTGFLRACTAHLAQGEARVPKQDALATVVAVRHPPLHRHHAKPLQVAVERHVLTLHPGPGKPPGP
jgi:hypothetical protein